MSIDSLINLNFADQKIVKEMVEVINRDSKLALEKHSVLNITLLHAAVRDGSEELAEKLIAKGADLNARDIDGNTPLHYAFEAGRWDMAKLLLYRGADARLANFEEQLACAMSKSYEWNEIISPDVFISEPFEQGILHTFCKRTAETKQLREFVIENYFQEPSEAEKEEAVLRSKLVVAMTALTDGDSSLLEGSLLCTGRCLVTSYNLAREKLLSILPAAEQETAVISEDREALSGALLAVSALD